jgi:RNA polymerase sigma-70 factor (ECF subfamily)
MPPEQPAGQEPESHARIAVAPLLAGLEPSRREAFVLTQMVGCSYAEAAAICDCPVGTIRSRVARAREDLIVLMADSGRPRAAGGASAVTQTAACPGR